MGLNLKNQKGGGNGGNYTAELLDAGNYPARVVRIVDLGIQAQAPYQGKEKPPAHIVDFTYELNDEFMIDKDGNPDESKPRWVSEQFALNPPSSDLAKSTKRAHAIDPNNEHDYDITQYLGMPCVVGLVQKEYKGKTYNNIGSVGVIRPKEAAKMEPLKNEPTLFVLDDPDMDVFGKFPQWLQDKIKDNLEFEGSELQKRLGGGKKPAKAKKEEVVEEQVDGDEPEGDDAW